MPKKFEDLDAFNNAVDLMVEVYRATKALPNRELYGLTSQMRRAAVSVVSHIAEGQGRLTDGEWRQLLSQGRGSLYEVEAQIIACARLGYLTPDVAETLRLHTDRTGKPLAGLIRYVRKRETTKKRSSNKQQETSNT